MDWKKKIEVFLFGKEFVKHKNKQKRAAKRKIVKKKPRLKKNVKRQASARTVKKKVVKKVVKRKKTALKKTPKKKVAKKKVVRKKAILKKKVAKAKVQKKAPAQIAKKKKSVSKKALPKKSIKSKPITAITKRLKIGEITHYFAKVNAAVIHLEKPLAIKQRIHIEGNQTNLKQTVNSLQINRIPIDEGRAGEDVGLEVKKAVHVGDSVYLL